jgi:hypothetical protein
MSSEIHPIPGPQAQAQLPNAAMYKPVITEIARSEPIDAA